MKDAAFIMNFIDIMHMEPCCSIAMFEK